ncbi:Hypothetical predicted protein [Podarcis lilfordi]|uniref:Uncharacterized protein n=1 Tax=Podarcis lilfordi TaxID=74358 RepID=A0AA35JXU0_9SAUR|nr:Hypothetical predicted protein [Podarcis lilfordi]
MDAVVCRQCATMRPWIPCMPLGRRCAAIKNKMTCIILKVYKGFQLWQKVMGCTNVDDDRCDQWNFDKRTGKLYTFSCCSDKDYCTQQ